MKVKTPLVLYCLLFTLSSSAIAQQNRTAIYGRVVGSDHRNEVPAGWVVRVTAFRVDNGQRVDQRDSVAELYCLTVPTNSIVRLTFETSYHPPGELGYSSTRLPTPIDTRPDDRQATVRAQPDVVLSRKIVHRGVSARYVIQEELNNDLTIARETGSADIVMANFKSYRRAYGSDQQILMDLNTAELNAAGYPTYKLLKGAPVAPAMELVQAVMREAYEKFKKEADGKNADYIPYLAKVDAKLFGIAIVSTDNQVLTIGDVNYSFSIQSISKVFSQALAMQELGAEKVFEKVGNEPTGRGFNSVFAVADMPTHTGNPYVNAGAISTVSLISGKTADEKWKKIVDFYSRVAGEKLKLIDEVYESEAATNASNKAISMLLAKYDRIYSDPFEAVEIFTKQSSVGVNVVQLAHMGATLANNGKNPATGEQVIKPENVPHILSTMIMAGLYDGSGGWAWRVGLPAKSGTSGGILAVIPGKGAIAVFAPPLDEAGNSVKAQKVIEYVTHKLNFNLFSPRAVGLED